jgi:hypothetical protein
LILVSLGFGFDADNGDIATKAFQQSDLNTRAGDSQRIGQSSGAGTDDEHNCLVDHWR